MSAVELGTDGWILLLTAVLVALTALLLVAPVIVYWLDSRGFKIRAHADELHRVRVRFNLKGAKSHAIQKVELHAVRPLPYRLRHRLFGRKKKTEPVAVDACAGNPTPTVVVGDPGDRVFVWTVRATRLPRRGWRAKGYDDRVPGRRELRVLIRVDERRFFLERVRPHALWTAPPRGSQPGSGSASPGASSAGR